jgi:hypothetical protein
MSSKRLTIATSSSMSCAATWMVATPGVANMMWVRRIRAACRGSYSGVGSTRSRLHLLLQAEGAHADTASRQSGDAERTQSQEERPASRRRAAGADALAAAVEQSAESQQRPSLKQTRQVRRGTLIYCFCIMLYICHFSWHLCISVRDCPRLLPCRHIHPTEFVYNLALLRT